MKETAGGSPGGRFPDFLGIGAQKAGTTWLGHNLQLHPEIWMPRLKELHYFDDRIDDPRNPVPRLYTKLKGRGNRHARWRRQVRGRLRHHWRHFRREDFLWDLKYYAGTPGDRWYAALFGQGVDKVIGEITPAYSTLAPEAVADVFGKMPGTKIIFLMRNPVERAWSQLTMRFGKNKGRAVETVTNKELRRNVERDGSQHRTNYMRTLENWGSLFSPEQTFVGFLEDVHFHPEKLLADVYEFLGVDATFKPPGVGERVHVRSAGRMLSGPAVYLSRLYLEEISLLEETFGGYASFWHYCASQLANDPPVEEYLPYPLWESGMWKEWMEKGAGSHSYQSGPLSSIRATA